MSNALKGLLWLIIAVVVLAGGYALYTLLRPTGAEPAAPIAGAPAGITDKLARGEYLARAADCVACHTAPGGTPYAGGFAFKLPFGTIYGTNITADKETGIGNWSDDQFVRAVREGIGPQGNLYPAMPYTSYTGLSRDGDKSLSVQPAAGEAGQPAKRSVIPVQSALGHEILEPGVLP